MEGEMGQGDWPTRVSLSLCPTVVYIGVMWIKKPVPSGIAIVC
jgi:hypothetical protein